MRAPKGAAKGKAKVKLSFAAWKGEKVAPATFEVVVAPETTGKSGKK